MWAHASRKQALSFLPTIKNRCRTNLDPYSVAGSGFPSPWHGDVGPALPRSLNMKGMGHNEKPSSDRHHSLAWYCSRACRVGQGRLWSSRRWQNRHRPANGNYDEIRPDGCLCRADLSGARLNGTSPFPSIAAKGFDFQMGHGLINAFEAVKAARERK